MARGMIVNLSCPACGGAISVGEGVKVAKCPYCRTVLFLEGDEGIYTVCIRNVLVPSTARSALGKAFTKGWKARDLLRSARITELFPIYVPFWKLKARAAGCVCGYEIRQVRDGRGNTRSEKEYIERIVLRDFEWSEVACDASEIGIRTLPSTLGEAVSHEDGSIPTFEATTSPDDAKRRGSVEVGRLAIESARVPNITYKRMHVLPRYLGLTFYPAWICRFDYKGRSYFAILDGVTGKGLSGRAPGDPLYQSLLGVGGVALGGVLAGLGLGGLAASGFLLWFLLGGTILGSVLAAFSFNFFRRGSEIVEGDIEAGHKRFKKRKRPDGSVTWEWRR